VAVASAVPLQIICTSLHTDNHASIYITQFFTGHTLVLTPNQQCQSTEVNYKRYNI